MNNLFLFGFILLVIGSVIAAECLLKQQRVQSALGKILPVYIMATLASIALGVFTDFQAPLVIALFWLGFFLCWFGVRSHLESSILLRMLITLHKQPVSADELVTRYLHDYGSQDRLAELQQADLLRITTENIDLTSRGARVIRLARLLGKPSTAPASQSGDSC